MLLATLAASRLGGRSPGSLNCYPLSFSFWPPRRWHVKPAEKRRLSENKKGGFLSIKKRQGHPLLPREFAIPCIGRLGAIVSRRWRQVPDSPDSVGT